MHTHAAQYNLDPAKLALFGISFGVPYAITPALINQWPFLRCLVAYYGYLNLAHFPDYFQNLTIPIDGLRAISPLTYVDRPMPPLLLVRAGRDHPRINTTILPFISAALEHNQPIELINYPEGVHGFDLEAETPRMRQVMQRTLSFLETYLK